MSAFEGALWNSEFKVRLASEHSLTMFCIVASRYAELVSGTRLRKKIFDLIEVE